jgi:recombination protein RecR
VKIPEPLRNAIEELSKLPSVGRKTAQRLALYLLKADDKFVESFLLSIHDLKTKLGFCEDCYYYSEGPKCDICLSSKRDGSVVCVVEEASDVIAIENTNEYSGLYHVLGGVLSPLSGKGAESLRIKELLNRIEGEKFSEVILALNPDTEGEATTLYIAKLLKSSNIKVSRIARGIPIGGDLEFSDEATIGRAFLGRLEI